MEYNPNFVYSMEANIILIIARNTECLYLTHTLDLVNIYNVYWKVFAYDIYLTKYNDALLVTV